MDRGLYKYNVPSRPICGPTLETVENLMTDEFFKPFLSGALISDGAETSFYTALVHMGPL